MRKFLLAGAALGAMTAAERAKGRYMRAPDEHPDADFEAFNNAGDVEVGKSQIEVSEDGTKPDEEAKPKSKAKPSGRGPREPAKPAEKAADDKAKGKEKPGADEDDGEDQDGEDEGGDDEEDEEEEKPAKRKSQTPSERIRELNRRLRQSERLRLSDAERLDRLEKGLQPQNRGDKSTTDIGEAPDPTDEKKYPLGHLDDRYIEDKLEWLSTKKAAERADAVLQREQETEQTRRAEAQHAELLDKVDDLSSRGSELYDDFQESVVESGMRGDWRLDQPTFEAAHEADHGAQILYELSQDKKEAARVAGLTPYGQAKFVMERDAEITAKAKPRTKPGASPPPQTKTSGTNSRTKIDPATDNLDDFEKAWKADEKSKS